MTFYPSSLNVWGFNCSFMFRTCRCLQKGATGLDKSFVMDKAQLSGFNQVLPGGSILSTRLASCGLLDPYRTWHVESWWFQRWQRNHWWWQRDLGENNLSVFGEMSMKWKKFWKKFGSKYARLLFLKAPAGNNCNSVHFLRMFVSIWCVPLATASKRDDQLRGRGATGATKWPFVWKKMWSPTKTSIMFSHDISKSMQKDVVPH